MAVCTKCGIEATENAAYCSSCGNRLAGRDASAPDRVMSGDKRSLKAFGIAGTVLGVILALAALSIIFFRMSDKDGRLPYITGNAASSFTSIGQVNGEVHVPLSSLVEGKLHFFLYRKGRTAVPFFVFSRPDGSIGAALDACNSCYRERLGFRQEGDHIICNDCGMIFRLEDVGVVTGGCSPIPLEAVSIGGDLVIKTASLEEARKYF